MVLPQYINQLYVNHHKRKLCKHLFTLKTHIVFNQAVFNAMKNKEPHIYYFPETDKILLNNAANQWLDTHWSDSIQTNRIIMHCVEDKSGYIIKHNRDNHKILISTPKSDSTYSDFLKTIEHSKLNNQIS